MIVPADYSWANRRCLSEQLDVAIIGVGPCGLSVPSSERYEVFGIESVIREEPHPDFEEGPPFPYLCVKGGS